jgi:hypothetical protein
MSGLDAYWFEVVQSWIFQPGNAIRGTVAI